MIEQLQGGRHERPRLAGQSTAGWTEYRLDDVRFRAYYSPAWRPRCRYSHAAMPTRPCYGQKKKLRATARLRAGRPQTPGEGTW